MLKSMKKPDPKKLGKAKTVVAYERKAPTSTTAPKSISRADAEAKMGRMETMFEEQRGIEEGERQFGEGYKGMDLKATRQKVRDLKGNETVKTTFRSIDGNEEVTKLPDSDILEVKKIGEYEKAGLGGTFRESIKDRADRLKAEKAARAKQIAAKYAPIAQKAREEYEAKKAKEKSGGNK
jgi:uncharacterized ParB-like nuclease family protein